MWKNNLKIALRNLSKQKVYTMINVMGLSVGIASCLLILLFVQNEFSFDRFVKDNDRIYRMVLERIYPNHSTFYAIIPHSFGDVAKSNFEDIEESTTALGFTDFSLTYKNRLEEEVQFDEEHVLAADSSFLRIFDFELIKGSREKILSQANEIVVTEEFSERYFKAEDPIGKTVRAGELEFTVSGVMEDVPENSHFKFSALLSAYTFPFFSRENFTGFSSFTYFKLKDGVDPDALEAKIPSLVDTYAAAQIERELQQSWEEYSNAGNGYRYYLQPLSKIHLDPQYLEVQMKAGGNIVSVYILIFVGFLILGIACINFMNLSTARSAERAKEVGVRKVMGSLRHQLMGQFLTEALVISAVGVLIALIIASISIPFFNDLTERSLSLPFNLSWVLGLLALIVFVGLLAGIYPAFMLSSFNPVQVMKGKFTGSQKGKWIRNGLVVFQFWISIVLIIGTLVIRKQMDFMQNKSLGFDKEQILVVERGFSLEEQSLETFLGEVRRLPEVQQAAATFAIPGKENSFFGIQFQPVGSAEILTTKSMVVFDLMPETLGLELVDGKWFSEDTNDSLYVVLNETAVKVLGIDDPIGSRLINNQETPDGNIQIFYTIIGIVKDFNFISLRDEITPLVMQSNEAFGNGVGQFVVAKIKPDQVASAINSIAAKWKEVAPEQAFKFSFLNENLDTQYRAEQQTGMMFSIFSMLAIFVSCIGLFALSAYITSLRTKEIGVRKVLGASVTGVVLMLSKDFTKMILLAFILAAPVAWYMMEKWWLENFAYSIDVTLGIVAASGLFVLIIAWLTVSYQSLKAAVANPINSLKTE